MNILETSRLRVSDHKCEHPPSEGKAGDTDGIPFSFLSVTLHAAKCHIGSVKYTKHKCKA